MVKLPLENHKIMNTARISKSENNDYIKNIFYHKEFLLPQPPYVTKFDTVMSKESNFQMSESQILKLQFDMYVHYVLMYLNQPQKRELKY